MALSYHLLCLLSHFISSECYILPSYKDFINDNKKDWTEAESHCLSTYNSHLLSIHDSHSFQSLRNKIIAIGEDSNHFWIGLVNTAHSSDAVSINYSWSDDTSFDFGTDLISGSFPWFDERPETPSIDQYVRLWGGSASLLWDDTNHDNEYFWICNDAPSDDNDYDDDDDGANSSNEPSESMEDNRDYVNDNNNNNNNTVFNIEGTNDIDSIYLNETSNTNDGDTNNNNDYDSLFSVQHSSTSNLNTFWRFALMAILVLASCIMLLRVRIVYKKYKNKRRASSIGIGPRQITDISIVESARHNNADDIPTLHFSSIDKREDTLDIGYNEIISPFTGSGTSQSDDLPQIPMVNVSMAENGLYNGASAVSLEIEHDVTTHIEGHNNSLSDQFLDSMMATFDINTLLTNNTLHEDLDDERRSILMIMEQHRDSNNNINAINDIHGINNINKYNDNNDTESYEDTQSSTNSAKEQRKNEHNSCNSFHSTMAAFDARSFKLKRDDEWSAVKRRDTVLIHEIPSREGAAEHSISAETSDDDGSETNIDDSHLPLQAIQKRESVLSVKEIEIKSNISQIMENLKRMKHMSSADKSTMVLD